MNPTELKTQPDNNLRAKVNGQNVTMDILNCVQQLCDCSELFEKELAAHRKRIRKFNGDQTDHDSENITNNNQRSSGNPFNILDKTENILQQIKTEIDLTFLDLEHLKGNLALTETLNEEKDESRGDFMCHFQQHDKNMDSNYWKAQAPFVFLNPRVNKFHQKVCCIIQVTPNTLTKNDIEVHASDTDEDLADCLESNDEQILSTLVTLESKNRTILHMEGPMHLYLPIVDHKQQLIPTIKYRSNGNFWQHGQSIQDMSLPTEKEICLLGTELYFQRFQLLQCVAVAMPQCEVFNITRQGAIVELQNDRNIKLIFPPNSFPFNTKVTTKGKLLSNIELDNATNRYSELKYVRQTSSLVTINCDQPSECDIEFSIHDSKIHASKFDNMTELQETLQRCGRWLVNNLNMKDIEPYLNTLFPSDKITSITNNTLVGDQIRAVISELQLSSEATLDLFIDILQLTSQSEAADRLNAVKKQVLLGRNQESLSEIDIGSDFDPDFEIGLDTVRIVSKSEGQIWTVKPISTNESLPNTFSVQLEAGSFSYSVLGVVVPSKMSDIDVCRAATVIEEISCLTNVTLVLRQNQEYPDDISIHCVRSDKLKRRLQELDKNGFTISPSTLPEFGLLDGEQLELGFGSNICLEGFEKKPFVMTFYSGLDVARYSGRLCVLNHEKQVGCDRYSGQITYRVISKRISIQRSGTISIYLPKPADEQLGYFNYTHDYQGKALAKFLAWQLTADNANSSRWIKHASELVREPTIYQQSMKHIQMDLLRGNQRERCEAFILYWADHFIGPHENKLERMMEIVESSPEKKAEALQFIKPYHLSGSLSNDSLKRMAYCLATDWEAMADKLGLGKKVISEIKDTQKTSIRQTLKMLDTWRVSDAAILQGTQLVKHLYDCARAAKCSAILLNMKIGHG